MYKEKEKDERRKSSEKENIYVHVPHVYNIMADLMG